MSERCPIRQRTHELIEALPDEGSPGRGQFAPADTATDLDRWMPTFLLYDTGMAQPNRAAIRADEVCNEIAEIDPA